MKVKDKLLERVNKTIKKYKMLKFKDRVLVGLSGGPDSICLLQILNRLKDEYRHKLYAFHLNHKLRGKESDSDEKFVKRFCQSQKMPIRVKSFNVKGYAKAKKLSIEQAAREIRYKLLEQERKSLKCNKIALGHNANDNVETVILNLTRGTGLTGLCGIPPTRDKIIRPLIEIERKAIIQYLKHNKIGYKTDTTNVDTKIPRNFVRRKIITELLKFNPKLVDTVTKSSAILRDEENYLNQLVNESIKKIVIKRSRKGMILDNRLLLFYNLALRKRILKSLIPNLGYDNIERILEISENKTVGTLTIPGNLLASKVYDQLYIGAPSVQPINRKFEIRVNQSSKIRAMAIELETKLMTDYDLAKKTKDTEVFDYDELSPPFYLRYRVPGDRFVPFGGKETKLKEVMINDKVPARVRSRIPLFCDSNEILWILGGRRSERGRIEPNTKNILLVRFKQWKDPLLKIG